MSDNLPRIYKKINSLSSPEEVQKNFSEICNLIDQNLSKGFLWISFYSYYNLFDKILNIDTQDNKLLENYLYILSKLREIIEKMSSYRDQIIEIINNNPFENQSIKKKIIEKFGENNPLLQNIEYINSIIISFDESKLNEKFLSVYNFLKLIKILSKKKNIDKQKYIQKIIQRLETTDLITITEIISDIIDYGINNSDDLFSKDFIQELLIEVVAKLYTQYEKFGKWRDTFITSAFENISRYFRIAGNKQISSALYLISAIENWNIKNYGYCAKCIYKISKMQEDRYISNFLILLSIKIAELEVSFEEEIKQWKQELQNTLINQENIKDIIINLLSPISNTKLKHFIIYKVDLFINEISKLFDLHKKINMN